MWYTKITKTKKKLIKKVYRHKRKKQQIVYKSLTEIKMKTQNIKTKTNKKLILKTKWY